MKNPKPYLFLIFLAMVCTSANAQIYNGRFYRFLQGPQAYDYGRFKTELVPPYILSALADTGSIAFSNDAWYGKKSSGDWVQLGTGTTVETGATHIETTGFYEITDSVNSVVCQYGDDVTSLVLPDPTTSGNREITIRNISGNNVNLNYDLKYSTSVSLNYIINDRWVRIKPDGVDWVVIQDNSSTTTSVSGSGALKGTIF